MKYSERLSIGGCHRFSDLAAGHKFDRPGSKTHYSPDQSLDQEHIFLDLKVDFRAEAFIGSATLSLRAIHSGVGLAVLDAVDLKIAKVSTASGQKLKFRHDGKKLTVTLPKTLSAGDTVEIKIDYRLEKTHCGAYFIKPDRHYPDKPLQLWTHGETEEARHWFPCLDAPGDKATTEIKARVPGGFFALSNGALLSTEKDRKTGEMIYHWRQAVAHSPYLVTLVAGKFSEITDSWDNIPITYYCDPGREEDTRRAFGKTPKMVEFFSNKIGVRYPYEKYAQIAVADFVMGGMEHTSATTQTDRVLMDAKAYPEFTADWLVSHELAHQWFGDLLTCKEWSHAWLNESFATYFEALFTEHDLGEDEFEYEMDEKRQSYLDEDKNHYRRAIVTAKYRHPDDLFDRHLYEKGACVLHTLRGLLGTELFWKAIHHYVKTFAGQAVETADLIRAIQESTGRNMRLFFDQWVLGPGHPDYTVRYWWDDKARKAHVKVEQKSVGSENYFSMPVELEFTTAQGPKKFTETIDGKEHSFSYSFAQEPKNFGFDPQYKILKSSKIYKPYAMWAYDLQTNPHCVGRIEAAREVAKVASEQSSQALQKAFTAEKFWGTAKEIAAALGQTRLLSAKNFLLKVLPKTQHPKIRRGVVEALGKFADKSVAQVLKKTYQTEKSYFVAAEALRSLGAIGFGEDAAFVRQALSRESWNDTIRANALAALQKWPEPAAREAFKKYVRYGQHPSARGTALAALARLAPNFPELLQDILPLLEDPQVRIMQSAIKALGDIQNPTAVSALKKISENQKLPYRTQAAAKDALLKISPNDKK